MWGCANEHFFAPNGGFPFPGSMVWLLGLVALLLIAWAVWPRREQKHRRGARADRDDAMRILRTRLAEGAISEEEFERLRRAVES